MSTPVLSVRDLVVQVAAREGLLTAFNGVSLEVGRGEVLGLVGEGSPGVPSASPARNWSAAPSPISAGFAASAWR